MLDTDAIRRQQRADQILADLRQKFNLEEIDAAGRLLCASAMTAIRDEDESNDAVDALAVGCACVTVVHSLLTEAKQEGEGPA